jgi:AT hook motif
MPEDELSEAASDNQPKRKRGRPRKWVDMKTHEPYAYEKQRRGVLDPTGDRTLSNRFYQERGTVALVAALTPETANRFQWIMGTVQIKRDGDSMNFVMPGVTRANPTALALMPGMIERWRREVKASILTELGRIAEEGFSDSRDLAVKRADELCAMEPKLTVKEAVRRLREWRLDRQPKPANEDQLADVIIEAIDAYFDRHVSTKEETAKLIDDALWGVMSYYEWLFEDEPEDADKDGISESASEKQEDTPC